MGQSEPSFSGEENQATYEAARELVQRTLDRGLHAVHDATNLTPDARARTVRVAERLDRRAVAVFVRVDEAARQARADELGPTAQQAHEALGQQSVDPSTSRVPHVVVDGREPPGANVDRILAADGFDALGAGGPNSRDASDPEG